MPTNPIIADQSIGSDTPPDAFSLRDLFAAMILCGHIASEPNAEFNEGSARAIYSTADLMLEERMK